VVHIPTGRALTYQARGPEFKPSTTKKELAKCTDGIKTTNHLAINREIILDYLGAQCCHKCL
jgi:hypothetical protein